MEYLSISQVSKKWGLSGRRIPGDAVKPNDERIKSGKYIKKQKQINNKLQEKTVMAKIKIVSNPYNYEVSF